MKPMSSSAAFVAGVARAVDLSAATFNLTRTRTPEEIDELAGEIDARAAALVAEEE